MRGDITISDVMIADLVHRAEQTYPYECCGVLVSKGSRVNRILSLTNNSENPNISFEADPMELYGIEQGLETDEDVGGFYHSHPDAPAELSVADEKNMIPGMTYLILSVYEAKITDIKKYRK